MKILMEIIIMIISIVKITQEATGNEKSINWKVDFCYKPDNNKKIMTSFKNFRPVRIGIIPKADMYKASEEDFQILDKFMIKKEKSNRKLLRQNAAKWNESGVKKQRPLGHVDNGDQWPFLHRRRKVKREIFKETLKFLAGIRTENKSPSFRYRK
uniref:Uncharacterized protein n=1 Tax=Clastoptera arizonana TaxID=38151 RepID=A0A1B6E973_9HEMI